jgi:hypothetical protein
MLPCRQAIVGSNEGADERGYGHRRPHRIHQAEPDGLDKGASLSIVRMGFPSRRHFAPQLL